MAISTWFCSSGFGPGPSSGTGETVLNGLAGPAMRKLKKAAQPSQTPIASGWYSAYLSRVSQVAAAM
jgi:hypothetical protein